MSDLIAVFVAVFLAELGDKTQLATLMFAARGDHSPWLVFVAAASALILTSALAVGVGTVGARYLEFVPLKLVAGVAFIGLGVWTLLEYFRAA
jgi:putative Ca2+/H+ antiporter (TMEM165/GDT1 family)